MDKKKIVESLLRRNVLVTPEMLSRMEEAPIPPSVNILFSHQESPKKRGCQDFVNYFNSRFRNVEGLLCNRPEMRNATTISRLRLVKEREVCSVIGMVNEKQVTKNGNILLKLEDQTGSIAVLVNKNKQSIFDLAKDLVYDEIVGVSGTCAGDVIFANNIILPDIPSSELRKSPEDGYAVFLSDLHVGSKKFLSDEFSRFLKWICGKSGSDEQKEIARKTKYVFIVGDLVDGVGVYPGQEEELEITDIYDQYRVCAELLSKIPSDKRIIISPGNHDSMRISEPQPAFYGEMPAPILKLDNVTAVSNPALVNIDRSADFPGIDVLMYHGYSFDYYVANVESIRTRGGYDRADLIMKFLLQRRHLAPSHSSTLYLPDSVDNLVVSRVPDIFVTGHIHKAAVSGYKHVTLISSSCWQSKTSFQEKMGHHPQPARVPVVNLNTREIKVLKFSSDQK
ncbi:DNA-directed DNA polymerase II small subunit [Candidatus Woesearchaeota archaeon]|nr:DNA-directed DNA polymerase II small subunit [Candidatus Woesearchaeota archaeon]